MKRINGATFAAHGVLSLNERVPC